MVRYIFLLLVITNIGFFVWSHRLTVPITKPLPASDPGISKIKLLSEIEPTIHKPQQSNQNNTPVMQQNCFSVGPFDNEAAIQTLQEQLKPLVLKTNIRALTTSQEAGYWIYLPALPTRADALAKGRELASAKIKDYYVVTAGNHENTVSLGLYRESFNADNRIAELSRKGFKAQKEVRIEQWPEYWLDYSITEEQRTQLPDLTTDHPNISINEVICQKN